MLTKLTETTSTGSRRERRQAPRFQPTTGAVYAEAVTPDGTLHRLAVGDLSTRGIRLLENLPVEVGEKIEVGVYLHNSSAPYRMTGVVVHRGEGTVRARFVG